jgi:hypothetical protein
MAIVTVGSIQITDFAGQVKSVPLYLPIGMSSADVILALQEYAPLIEAAIDGKVTALSFTVGVDLPGGLKANAANGNLVNVGALLAFDVEDSNYSHSIYIPTWENAGFSGKSVLNTGVYATLITALVTNTTSVTDGPTSEEGNDLVSFLRGSYRVRK